MDYKKIYSICNSSECSYYKLNAFEPEVKRKIEIYKAKISEAEADMRKANSDLEALKKFQKEQMIDLHSLIDGIRILTKEGKDNLKIDNQKIIDCDQEKISHLKNEKYSFDTSNKIKDLEQDIVERQFAIDIIDGQTWEEKLKNEVNFYEEKFKVKKLE